MAKNLTILLTLAMIIALPFIFRHTEQAGDWRSGDPVLVIISPHNEAIRYEFEHAFSRWHAARHQRADGTPQPVKIDWRNVGGTTEISRYLQGEYATTSHAWWDAQGKTWPGAATDAVGAPSPPTAPELLEIYRAARSVDAPDQITSSVDLFFGGGQYDHDQAFRRGFAVEPWPANNPPTEVAESLAMIPPVEGGEIWRTPTLFGNAVSTFGIVYNVDRLADLRITKPPATWDDLADFRYFHQVGVTDPTKSGSIAKAFEMLVHQKMHDAARAYLRSINVPDEQGDARIKENEAAIDAYIKTKDKATYQRGDVPDELKDYQAALERGWLDGVYLIQSIGANARYFTDSATKVSLDVSIGDAAVGMSIDFYGRFQEQSSRAPDGTPRMVFVTPAGGTSVSCDPITLLRGAPNRALAVEFITFVLSSDGQKLWTYAPGATNEKGEVVGNEKYALRRLPIRRDFYASTQPAIEAAHIEHKQHSVDDLTDPKIDPYQLAKQFVYYKRWTGDHFPIMRDITRAMCMDSGDELRDAWARLHVGTQAGVASPERLAVIRQLPTVTLHRKDNGTAESVTVTWRTAPDIAKLYDAIEYSREWTGFFRETYRKAASGSGTP